MCWSPGTELENVLLFLLLFSWRKTVTERMNRKQWLCKLSVYGTSSCVSLIFTVSTNQWMLLSIRSYQNTLNCQKLIMNPQLPYILVFFHLQADKTTWALTWSLLTMEYQNLWRKRFQLGPTPRHFVCPVLDHGLGNILISPLQMWASSTGLHTPLVSDLGEGFNTLECSPREHGALLLRWA